MRLIKKFRFIKFKKLHKKIRAEHDNRYEREHWIYIFLTKWFSTTKMYEIASIASFIAVIFSALLALNFYTSIINQKLSNKQISFIFRFNFVYTIIFICKKHEYLGCRTAYPIS